MVIHQETVQIVRETVLNECEKEPESFDFCDVERVRHDDDYVYRFVQDRYGKADEASRMLLDALRWRKSYGVNQMKSSDFPQEIFQVGELFEFHKDKNGISTLYLRVDRHRPLPAWKEIIKRFIIFNIERAEKIATENGAGIGLVVDARNGKIYHVEIDLDYFALKSIINYYPGCLQYLAIYEIPWVLMAILKLIRTWLPPHYQEKIQFINKSNADEFIGLENFPQFMGGERPMLWPEECLTSPPAIKFEEDGSVQRGGAERLHKIYSFALQEFYQTETFIKSQYDSDEDEKQEMPSNQPLPQQVAHLAQVAT